MQYWLYAFKWYKGNVLIAKCETLEEARIEMDRLDRDEYEYADIVAMEWEKEPRLVSSCNFEYEKGKTKVKRLIKENKKC
jgi:hypothetical protein